MDALHVRTDGRSATAVWGASGLPLGPAVDGPWRTGADMAFAAVDAVVTDGRVRLADPADLSRVSARRIALANPVTGQVCAAGGAIFTFAGDAEGIWGQQMAWAVRLRPSQLQDLPGTPLRAVTGLARVAGADIDALVAQLQAAAQQSISDVLAVVHGPDALAALPFSPYRSGHRTWPVSIGVQLAATAESTQSAWALHAA